MTNQRHTGPRTPSDEELEPFEGEWVAMANGAIAGHSADLAALIESLAERGVRHDSLFFVPDAVRREELRAAYR